MPLIAQSASQKLLGVSEKINPKDESLPLLTEDGKTNLLAGDKEKVKPIKEEKKNEVAESEEKKK